MRYLKSLALLTALIPNTAFAVSPTSPDSSEGINLEGASGKAAFVSLLGQLKVATSERLSGGVFNGTTLDATYFTEATAAGGTVVIGGGQATLSTTTDSGSGATLYGNSVGRYIGANSNYFRTTLRIDNISATNNVLSAGVATGASPNDGFWFKITGSNFCITYELGGTQTDVCNGNFNGALQTVPVTNTYHNYEVHYTAKTVEFFVDDILLHTLTATNTPLVATRNFKPFLANTNTGVGSAVKLYAMNMTVNRLGSLYTQPKRYIQSGASTGVQLKGGPGTLRKVCPGTMPNNGTVSIYDALSATGTPFILSFAAGYPPNCLSMDENFDTGLFIVQTGAGSNVKFIYE